MLFLISWETMKPALARKHVIVLPWWGVEGALRMGTPPSAQSKLSPVLVGCSAEVSPVPQSPQEAP